MKLRVLTVFICVLAARAPQAIAQHGFWQPDERILLTSFLIARDIATDHRHVWVATALGLEIYDAAFQRWLPPSTIEDGYPVREVPARLVYDPRDRLLWLLTEMQTLYSYSPPMQSWERRFVSDLSPDARDALRKPREIRDPAWAVVRNFIGRDASMRHSPISGVVPGERNGTYWAATMGGNFAFVDTRSLSSESYVFGTITPGVTSIAVDRQGNFYFGGDGTYVLNGIARADSTLQRWQHYESRIAGAPRGRVHAMVAGQHGVYAGADDGLFLLRNDRWRRIADLEVHALASAGARLWVGSRGKLGWVDQAGAFNTIAEFPVQNVHHLAARGDTVWIAASGGLFEYAGNALRALLATTTFGVAVTSDAVIAVTSRGIVFRAGDGWVDVPSHASYSAIGRFISVKAEGTRVWFGGTTGLAEWNTTSNSWRHLSVPADIPEGPVYDVVHQNGRLWLATPAGALGLQWK